MTLSLEIETLPDWLLKSRSFAALSTFRIRSKSRSIQLTPRRNQSKQYADENQKIFKRFWKPVENPTGEPVEQKVYGDASRDKGRSHE